VRKDKALLVPLLLAHGVNKVFFSAKKAQKWRFLAKKGSKTPILAQKSAFSPFSASAQRPLSRSRLHEISH